MRKILGTLSLISWFFLLTACGNSTPAPTPMSSNPVAAPTATPAPVSCDLGDTIVVGVSTESKPFVYETDNGTITGFDMELMNLIAEEAGFSVEYADIEKMSDANWGSIFKDLAAGKFAAVISQASITPEREALVAFSDPYYKTGLVIVVPEGSAIQGRDDLIDQRTAVQEGTTSERWVRDNTSAVVVPKPDITQAFNALNQGEVDAIVHDERSAVAMLRNYPNLIVLNERLREEAYGIAVRQSCPALLDAINTGLDAAMASNDYLATCETWQLGAGCLSAPATAETESTPAVAATATPPALSCDVPAAASTMETGEPYEIQPGDWLSAIAEREYGNPLDYRAIVAYTNEKCAADATYTCIASPDNVGVGWSIYLPSSDEVAAYWNELVVLPPIAWEAAGDIKISGSSTVYLLTQHMARCFEAGGFEGHIQVESTGTGAGMKQFCGGDEVDIVDASRPIHEDERSTCLEIGREPTPFQIGADAIVISISQQNEFLGDVTLDELRQILSTAETWADVRIGWPPEPIQRFYPTEESGTFDVLVNKLFDGDQAALLEASNIMKQSEDDEALVHDIAENPHAVGFFGYAYYKRNRAALRALPVNGVEPNPVTVDLETYPLVRPLFIYTSSDVIQEKAQVAAFINFYLQRVKHYIIEVGYFLPNEAAYTEAMQAFNELVQE